MASKGYVSSLLNALQTDLKRVLTVAFGEVLDNFRLGVPDDGTRSENFQIYWFEGKTSSTAGTEFSIKHGLNVTPHLAIPVLPLDTVGLQWVPLTVSRAADAQRVYFTSTSTGVTFRIGLEL